MSELNTNKTNNKILVLDTEISKEDFLKNINIILNQTDMTYEDAEKKLNEYNNDYMKVLREYYGIKNNSKQNTSNDKTSINQMIYKEIRTYMNDLDSIRKKKIQ